MFVYSTTTGNPPYDPQGYAEVPLDMDDYDEHYGCVHSIGYCGLLGED